MITSIFDYDDACWGKSYHFVHGQWAARRGGSNGSSDEYVEQSELWPVGDLYEAKMYWLRCLRSSFWGFSVRLGGDGCLRCDGSGRATIEHLAMEFPALLTTVVTLLVAIPIVFVYNGLLSMARGAMTKLENFSSNLADRIELEKNV